MPKIFGGGRRTGWMENQQYWLKSCETEKWLMLDKAFGMRKYLNPMDQE